MDKVLIKNAAEIVTPRGHAAQCGKDMQAISRIEHGAVVIHDGVIQAVDTTENILRQYNAEDYTCIDAAGKSVIPGFVDAHTHFIFGGYRPHEFMARLDGRSYMEIMAAGGGIASTVNSTREASEDQLYVLGKQRLNAMAAFGITTVEGKSGYGLDLNAELKQLAVLSRLNHAHPLEVVSTFMGAHALPKEFADEDAYIDFLIDKVMPEAVGRGLAEFCDVFCEKGVFSVPASERLLKNARAMGFKLKLHADEICSFGGAELAGRLGAVSADHLLHASPEGIDALARGKVVATLLPSTAFCLKEKYAPARAMIDAGCAVALASDYNPGSCFTNSIPLLLALACIHMHMTVEEALTALTLNGAAAVGRADRLGSIEPGKAADMVILQYPSYKYLVYHTGISIVDKTIKMGKVIWESAVSVYG